MAWTNLTFSFGAVLTSAQMTQLDDNFDAIMAKASGAPQLAASYVTTSMIATNAVTAAEIAANAITTTKIATDAITTAKIINGQITDVKMAPNAVTNPTLVADVVTADKIATDAVTAAEIAANAVHRSEIYTVSGSVSTTNTLPQLLALPGGAEGFYPILKSSSATGVAYWGSSSGVAAKVQGTVYAANIYLYVNASINTAYAYQEYLAASPPYDLGDGEAPFFIFANMDSQGNVVSLYAADTPPWVYNGPTKVTADRYGKDGKQYIKRKIFTPTPPIPANATVAQKVAHKRAVLEARRSATIEEVELTPLMKNADMDLIPHPFENKAGVTPVLLDPMSPTIIDLMDLYDNGEGEDINGLLHDGYINIGNTPLPRKGPAGLMIVDANWRLT